MSWITEMRNPLRVAATYTGMVGTRPRVTPGYVHSGVDIGVVTGTQVYSTRSGTVAYAGYYPQSGYGNFVVIDHGNGVYSAYAHLDAIATTTSNGAVRALQAGDSVTSNTLIGLSGSTGDFNATSSATDSRLTYPPHLHFEIRGINGVVVTQTDAAGLARPVIIDETGARSNWASSGAVYREQLRNPEGPGGQVLYDPSEVVRLYGAEMSESAAFVQERFLRIYDPYGRRDPTGMGQQQWPPEHVPSTPHCFVAGTMIDMADGTKKPIERISEGDWVLAYDENDPDPASALKPARVSRTFRNQAKHILDLHGTKVTPGHVMLCGDGPFCGRHLRLIDILCSDGTIVDREGRSIRAATNCPVGSPSDRYIWAVVGTPSGHGSIAVEAKGRIRLGTRIVTSDGADFSVLDIVEANGWFVTEDGLLKAAPDASFGAPLHWTFGERLPRPEDYVLQRSRLTIDDILSSSGSEAWAGGWRH